MAGGVGVGVTVDAGGGARALVKLSVIALRDATALMRAPQTPAVRTPGLRVGSLLATRDVPRATAEGPGAESIYQPFRCAFEGDRASRSRAWAHFAPR